MASLWDEAVARHKGYHQYEVLLATGVAVIKDSKITKLDFLIDFQHDNKVFRGYSECVVLRPRSFNIYSLLGQEDIKGLAQTVSLQRPAARDVLRYPLGSCEYASDSFCRTLNALFSYYSIDLQSVLDRLNPTYCAFLNAAMEGRLLGTGPYIVSNRLINYREE